MRKLFIAGTALAGLTLWPLSGSLAQGVPATELPEGHSSTRTETMKRQLSEQDRQFLEKAAGSRAAGLGLARLAQAGAGSEEVKRYASNLVDNYIEIGEELRRIAHEQQLELPTGVPADARQDFADIKELEGRGFDRKFIREAVQRHQSLIELLSQEAEEGDDAALRKFAAGSVDMWRENLETAQALQQGAPVDVAPSDAAERGAAEGRSATDDPHGGENGLKQMTAGDIIGKTVVNNQGDDVGEVSDIVLGGDEGAMQAIVAVGGILGVGEKKIAVAFDELRPGEGDQVLLRSDASVEALKRRPAYEAISGYSTSVPRDRTLGEGTRE